MMLKLEKCIYLIFIFLNRNVNIFSEGSENKDNEKLNIIDNFVLNAEYENVCEYP